MRSNEQLLHDVLAAAMAIEGHLRRGPLTDGLVLDAVRVRLIEIGEAVKGIDRELLDHQPAIPWSDVAGMRDYLAHRYFDTDHSIITATVENDLPRLVDAVHEIQRILATEDPD